MLIRDVIDYLEGRFPRELAQTWDNVGLNIGNASRELKGVLVTLDVTEAVLQEAINKGVNLIVTHHPFIFSPLKAIDTTTALGRMIELCMKHDVSIYVMHTNYDVSGGGMNDVLIGKLGVDNATALLDDGADAGLGRCGNLASEMDIRDCIKFIESTLSATSVSLVDAGTQVIKRVAVIGGSGSKFIKQAKNAGADLLITGDVTYHTALDALDLGISVLDIGHHAEVVMKTHIETLINVEFGQETAVASEICTNPFSKI